MDEGTPAAPSGYVLVRRIGRGASSVVWEAEQPATNSRVALKLLEADVSDPAAARRFAREREVMTALASRPGILSIYDAGVQDGHPWLALELCRRGSLSASGPMDPPTLLTVLVRLADALTEAHELGVVHCDLKPANIMVTDAGEPAVGDFGIARVSVGRATTTTVGGFSLDHVAPELLDKGKPSPRSDIYSLGTTIWELAAGHPPFRRSADVSVLAVMHRIVTEPLGTLESLPPELGRLLQAMTAKAPHERPASMAKVADQARRIAHDLDIAVDERPALPPLPAWADDLPIGAATVHRPRPALPFPEPDQEAATPTRPQRTLALTLAAAVVVLAVAGTAVVLNSGAPPTTTRAKIEPGVPDTATSASLPPATLAPPSVVNSDVNSDVNLVPGAAVGGSARGHSGPPAQTEQPPLAPVGPGPNPPTATPTTSNPPIVEPLVMSSAQLPRVVVGRSWSFTFAATGGSAPYRWSISAGAVPRGFVLQTDGSFNGRATSTGSASFTVAVIDADSRTASGAFTITPVAIVGDINSDGQVNEADKDILMGQYNQTGSGLSGDLNHDDVVNLTDLSILLSHWNKDS